MRIIGLGHALLALAAASVAILSLAYGDFAPMWQSIPVAIHGRLTALYGSAALLLAASAGLCFARTALLSTLTIGAYLLFWAAASMPAALANPRTGISWYGLCEAASSLVGAGILYALLRWPARRSGMPIRIGNGIRAATVLFGLTCVFYGWSHFAFAAYTASMVPAWLPHKLGFAYFTGLCHIAAGVGLIIGVLARLAAALEATMMSLFALLVWVPSLVAKPRPEWAGTLQNQWSELIVNLLLAAAAWIVADSLRNLHIRETRRVV